MEAAKGGGKDIQTLFCVDRPAETTREKLIVTAMELFYQAGFHAVGLDQVLAAVGVTKTTFYNHFESKDALALEVLRLRNQWEGAAWKAAVAARVEGGDPRRMLLAYFDVMHDWFNHPDFRGCLFVTAAHEFPLPHDPLHLAAREHMDATLDWLAELAERAGAAEPEALAERLTLLGHGAVTMRQSADCDGAALIARRVAEVLLEHHLPAAV